MPQSLTQKANTTFIRGLITEAGELTFPEDASVDELNCSLSRDGSRRRRLGAAFEDSYEYSDNTYVEGQVTRTRTWENVGGEAGLEYSVVQIGAKVFFYNKGVTPLSGQAIPTSDADSTVYEIDLATYARPVTLGASTAPIEVASINGALVIVSKEIEPIYVERDSSDGTFSITQISFRVRDFAWQGDRSTYDEESSTSTPGDPRIYDTQNTGWVGTKGAAALSTYRTANSNKYPALTHPWYSGKDANGDFDEAEWQKVYSGSTLIVNGHYILDLFDKDRNTASGLTGVTDTTDDTRFTTVASYASRIFYAGMSSSENSSRIYFSQFIETLDYIGDCYQINDPTSEETSDLLDTDGGFVNIPEAHNIKKLHVFGAKLLVFADNGVWAIGGVDDVFRATEYSVTKLTNVGLSSVGSFASADGRPYWWSAVGIHTVVVDEVGGTREENISIPTIQTHWENISASAKLSVISEYDAINRRVFWFYNSDDETNDYKFNEILILDEVLQAFYPWTISDTTSNSPYICGTSFFRGVGTGQVEYTVVDSDGNTVVDSSGNTVISTQLGTVASEGTDIKLLVFDPARNQVTFAGFTDTDFYDWETANYSSYAEGGYDFIGDMTLKKNAPYVTVYLRRTETGWTGDETTGYDPIRESSCLVSAFWDFKDTASSSAQQAYRLKETPIVDANDLTTFDYPYSVITTRLKLRGRGRSMRVKFESEEGKDFDLLGWEVIGARNPNI